jgi:hypothetical protein
MKLNGIKRSKTILNVYTLERPCNAFYKISKTLLWGDSRRFQYKSNVFQKENPIHGSPVGLWLSLGLEYWRVHPSLAF